MLSEEDLGQVVSVKYLLSDSKDATLKGEYDQFIIVKRAANDTLAHTDSNTKFSKDQSQDKSRSFFTPFDPSKYYSGTSRQKTEEE